MVYPAKHDWWIACLMTLATLVPLGVGVVIAYQTVTQAIPAPARPARVRPADRGRVDLTIKGTGIAD